MEVYNKETCKIEKAEKATTAKVKNDIINFLTPDLKIVPQYVLLQERKIEQSENRSLNS